MTQSPFSDDSYKFGFRKPENYVFKSKKGLDRGVVVDLSDRKKDPPWMREFRLKALDQFFRKPLPTWGGNLSTINFDDIYYYINPTEKPASRWDQLPVEIRDTYDRIGIPEAEKKFLSGVSAQYESEVVYKSIHETLSKKGVIFLDMDSGLREYHDIVKQYFGTVIPPGDNKFAALNSAVWSGGSFVYVPKGVRVDLPLQAYFRINAANMGQFERTLIIAEEGSFVHYVEGCFTKGVLITTESGYKAIETVRVGDRVLTHAGTYGSVYHTQERSYRGALYTITFYGDSSLELNVTSEHPFLVARRKRGNERNTAFPLEWVKAQDLKSKDYFAMPINSMVDTSKFHIFETYRGAGRHVPKQIKRTIELTPEFFRLVGYYLAEGSISSGAYVNFSFSIHEHDYIEDVKRLVRKVFGISSFHESVHKKNHGISLVICSVELARIFVQFGTSSDTKHLPSWMMFIEPEKQKEIIVGWFRGDGNYYSKKNTYGFKEIFRINTTSTQLVRQCRDILLRLKIVAFINERIRAKEGRKTLYTLGIGGEFMVAFGRIVGIPVLNTIHGHKRATLFAIDDHYAYFPIKSIRKRYVKRTPVYNFSVKKDESYVAGGVAVHNCTAPVYTTDSLHSAVVEIIVKKGARVRYTTIQNWSTNVYNLVTKRARVEEEGVMEWVDGNLGCLAEGSTVTTPEGVKTIESLTLGDRVLSYDDQKGVLCFKKVIAKRFSGDRLVHTVSIGKRTLCVTANHPFYSYIYDGQKPKKLGRYRLAYVRADQLKKAIVPRVSIDYGTRYSLKMPGLITTFESYNQYAPTLKMTRTREARMIKIAHTDDAVMWLFGYWIGDGNIDIRFGKTNGVIRWAKVGFSTPREDRARKRLMIIMKMLIDIVPTERSDGHHLAWSSKELAEFFHLNGFKGNARTKYVPKWIWSLPESQRLSFIAGYIDADGHIDNRFHIKSVNRLLLEDIASLLITLGITSHIFTEFAEPKRVRILGVSTTAHGAYRLDFPIDRRFIYFVSSDIREQIMAQPAKKLQMHRFVGRSSVALHDTVEIVPVVVSKQSSDMVPTWDIEVEGTGNFVSHGFIVHNSKLTMKYPSVYLVGRKAHGEILSIAVAGAGQHQDAGGKVVHLAAETTSQIISKSISRGGGRTSYRGLVQIIKGAANSKSKVVCDALLLDEASRSDTYPTMKIDEQDVVVEHEATVSKIGDEQLFYLESRGIGKAQAESMIVNGFIEPIVKELPLEYAVELNRLIQLQMEGSVG